MKNIFLKSSIHIIFVCIAMLLVTGCTQNSSVTHIQSDVTDTKILENIQEQDKVIENSADIQAAPVGKNNSKKVIMVTGTASGIGKATAEKLIANGHIVYGGDINTEGNSYLDKIGGYALEMDVTKDDQVQSGIDKIIAEQGRIDVLINNAGYGSYSTIENIDIDELKNQFDVNVFGYARLQQAVLPYMREQRSGRIINVSSLLGKFSGVGLGWYASTKHAVEGMSDSLRLEVVHLGIEVVKIQPSAVNTNFEAVAFELLDNSNIPEDYKQMISDFKTGLEAFYDQAEGPDGTAETIVEAVESIAPEITYITAGGEEFLKLRKQMSEEEFYKMISGE